MKIDAGVVENVAKLARLDLTDDEKNLYAGQMDSILAYVEKLRELNTDGVVPTSHAVPVENAFREDAVTSETGVDQALANAPDRVGSYYRVPKVIE